MADHKRNQVLTDDQKASSIAPEQAPVAKGDSKKKIHKAPKIKKARKKGMPLVLDILIVCVLIAVVVASVWGIYKASEYFATRYAQREITYTLLADDVNVELAFDDAGKCVVTPKSDVFVEQDGQSVPVGQVLSVSTQENEDGTVDVYVTVTTTADYNYKLGYFADQIKIAVGKSYTCRFCNLMDDAMVVELQVTEEES